MNPKPITRFAPSPTGFLHIGSLRTALFAYLWAKKNDGTFILRIEDTDTEREVEGSIDHIKESLRWVNIDWDYGPDKPGPFGSCIQSERLDSYKVYAQKLIDKGLAYPDPYTQEELAAFRTQAETEKRPFLYRDHRPETFEAWDGQKPLRFKVANPKRYKWHDVVRGDLEAGEEALDDFILIKSDGYPTYNFAHIIDDHLMGVTHILRADEFISSTPRFLSLYEALEIPVPALVTLPPIMREDKKKKLGKRDGAKDILDYRAEGYLPEAMVNFLALIGWNPGTEQEVFTFDELLEAFTLERIHKAGGVFNEEKLRWFNQEHIKKLSDEDFAARALPYLPEQIKSLPNYSSEKFHQLIPVLKERIATLGELTSLAESGELDCFFTAPTPSKELLKNQSHFAKVISLLETVDAEQFTPETVKTAVWDYATEQGRGEVLWPMRVALSGKEKSPDPFTIASLIGKEETLNRLRHAQEL